MNIMRPLMLVLILNVTTLAQTKPILLIFKSDRCPPCRQFDREMVNDKNFKNTLCSSFDLRVLSIDTEEGRATANHHGILQIPAFILFKNNKPITKPIYGFSPTRAGKALFLSQLSIISQPQQRQQSQLGNEIRQQEFLPEPVPNPNIEIPQNNVRNIVEESSDNTSNRIREALSELRSDLNRSLTASEEKLKNAATLNKVKFNELDNKVTDLIESQNSIELKLNSVTDKVSNLSETVAQINKTTNNISSSQSAFEKVFNNSTQSTIGLTETSPDATPPSSGFLSTLTKLGIGAAATAFGWPIAGTALGTAALGLGVGFIRNRLKKNNTVQPTQQVNQPSAQYNPYQVQPTTTQSPPTQYSPYKIPTEDLKPQIVTETRFVNKEVDIVGESYKEAIRKVANTLGDTNPAYKDVAAMIEHTAKEIERGKRRPREKDSSINPETDLKLLWEDKK